MRTIRVITRSISAIQSLIFPEFLKKSLHAHVFNAKLEEKTFLYTVTIVAADQRCSWKFKSIQGALPRTRCLRDS